MFGPQQTTGRSSQLVLEGTLERFEQAVEIFDVKPQRIQFEVTINNHAEKSFQNFAITADNLTTWRLEIADFNAVTEGGGRIKDDGTGHSQTRYGPSQVRRVDDAWR